ncbi:MAG: hypothetical protein GC201_18380 [Alphaproteobacteria bacterium]|nr:hypothetical protein [Alphaproteobacteria bacterium]
MNEKQPLMAVYGPPEPEYPYLAVTIAADGTVTATCHTSLEEAEARVARNMNRANPELGRD